MQVKTRPIEIPRGSGINVMSCGGHLKAESGCCCCRRIWSESYSIAGSAPLSRAWRNAGSWRLLALINQLLIYKHRGVSQTYAESTEQRTWAIVSPVLAMKACLSSSVGYG